MKPESSTQQNCAMRITALAATVLLLAGCELITGISEERHLGVIGYPDDTRIETPVAVEPGESFTVTVRTYGANGCWRKNRTQVTVVGQQAVVSPFDVYRRGRGIACTDMVVDILHTAELTFVQPGPARITIAGRDGVVERTVIVSGLGLAGD
jgi:hypothetical protein